MHRRVLRRMGWIEASLRFAGRFASGEKAAYMDRFGISTAQTSHDQNRFAQGFNTVCGTCVVEVTKGKLCVSLDAMMPPAPVFEMPGITEWLQAVMGSSFYYVEPARRTDPHPSVLSAIVVAIRKRVPLDIVYLSRSSGMSRRIVSPHVIIDVADRLHLRAYDHVKNRFSDFVMSRIQESGPVPPDTPFVPSDQDKDWKKYVEVEIRAHVDLNGDRLQGVIRDFGLDEQGRRFFRQRAAVAPYLVDEPVNSASGFTSPISVRIL